MGFAENNVFSTHFCPYYSRAIWRLSAEKLINTIQAEFAFFHLKNMIPLFFGNSACNFCRKLQKKKIMIINILFYFFAFFSKTIGLSFDFNTEMNSACQNTLVTTFLWDLQKKVFFLGIFALTSMATWRLGAEKLINTILVEFEFFPSKKHDSIGFRQFCL